MGQNFMIRQTHNSETARFVPLYLTLSPNLNFNRKLLEPYYTDALHMRPHVQESRREISDNFTILKLPRLFSGD